MKANLWIFGLLALILLPIANANNLTVCDNLSSSNTSYTLDNDINASLPENGSCFIFYVSTSNITLDCAGHSITGNRSGNGVFVNNNNPIGTIKNCNILNFSDGIHIEGGNYLNISFNNIHSNANDGIYDYATQDNIISNNTIDSNVGDGIYLFSQYIYSRNNVFKNNILHNNSGSGIYINSQGGNYIYNNIFNKSESAYDAFRNTTGEVTADFFNNPINCTGTKNIIGGNCTGGNAWVNMNGTGFSQIESLCNGNYSSGICANNYSISGYNAHDYYPLAFQGNITGNFTALSVFTPVDYLHSNYALTPVNYIIDADNFSSAACSVLNINGSGYDLPNPTTEIVNTNVGIWRYYPMAQGNQTIRIYCQNGSDWIESDNITFYVEPIQPFIYSPLNDQIFNDFTIPIEYTYLSWDVPSALCNVFIDNDTSLPPALSYSTNESIHRVISVNMTEAGYGDHNVSVYCQNGTFYGQSGKKRITILNEGINFFAPIDGKLLCGSNRTNGTLQFFKENLSSAWCGYYFPDLGEVAFGLGILDRIHNFTVNVSHDFDMEIPKGAHQAVAYCGNFVENDTWVIETNETPKNIGYEPICLTIFSPLSNAKPICGSNNLNVNMSFTSNIFPTAGCGIAIDDESLFDLIFTLPGRFYFLSANASHIISAANITNGSHHYRIICVNITNGTAWEMMHPNNISFYINPRTCDIVNTMDALSLFSPMVMFIISLIVIASGIYIGFMLGGSLVAVSIMIGLMFVFALIPNPAWIPLWIAIVALIGGILGAIMTQNKTG